MPDYALFGRTLRSEVELPELVPSGSGAVRAHWTLRIGATPARDGDEPLCDEVLNSTCHIRLTRAGDAYRYHHSCTGTFDVSPEGLEIVWSPSPRATMDSVRTDLVARVLPLVLTRPGLLCLHGSAVAWGGRAIALLGQKGSGKSTFALAAARAGAVHLSDDVLPVELDGAPVAWPGDHTMRLNDDSAIQLTVSRVHGRRRGADGKLVVSKDAREALRLGPAALSAIYLLTPANADGTAPTAAVERLAVPSVRAVPELVAHLKVGEILHGSALVQALDDLARLVVSVPVYRLTIARDWSRLPSAVAKVRAWHGEDSSKEHVRSA